MSPFPAFFCCAPGVGPREFLVFAVLALALIGVPMWAWYRKQKLANQDHDHDRPIDRS